MKWEYKVLNVNAHFITGGTSERKLQDMCSKLGEMVGNL